MASHKPHQWGIPFFLFAVSVPVTSLLIFHAVHSWGIPEPFDLLVGLVLSFILGWLFYLLFIAPIRKKMSLLGKGISLLKEREYAIHLDSGNESEIEWSLEDLNLLAERLRKEHIHSYQQELLLDVVFQHSPGGLLLINKRGRIIKASSAAKNLFQMSIALEGLDFGDIRKHLHPHIQKALEQGRDELVTYENATGVQNFHIAQRQFLLNTVQHRLIMIVPLNEELMAHEVQLWKKVIRTMNHEFNNSLAPVSSMLHSAQVVLRKMPEPPEKMGEILEAAKSRLTHLASFLQSYAQFARHPKPNSCWIPSKDFLKDIQALFPLKVDCEVDRLFIDPDQVQQAIINLLKNAQESGSPSDQIKLSILNQKNEIEMRVEDRGSGIAEKDQRRVLLPFFTTKDGGTGIGLALCREIAEGHGGRCAIRPNQPKGTVVSLFFPKNETSN